MKPTKPSSKPDSEVQRQHAEQEFAGELAELAAADDRPRPPNWKLSPWAVRTYVLGGKLATASDHAQIRRQRAADRDRRSDAGNRPGAAAARGPGHGEVLGLGAPRGRDLRRLDAAHPGHGGHRREGAPLRLELRAAARRGAAAAGAGP